MNWTPRRLKWLLNLYPPYLGAGIRTDFIDPQWREIRVSMKLRWYNRNIVGTHFGGSLYSMVDPHLMLLIMNRLGADYTVWDKSAEIQFLRPGLGRMRATFRVTDQELDAIREQTAGGEAACPHFIIDVVDDRDALVARVSKELHVRLRKEAKGAAKPK